MESRERSYTFEEDASGLGSGAGCGAGTGFLLKAFFNLSIKPFGWGVAISAIGVL